jgi:hypothetical protein
MIQRLAVCFVLMKIPVYRAVSPAMPLVYAWLRLIDHFALISDTNNRL